MGARRNGLAHAQRRCRRTEAGLVRAAELGVAMSIAITAPAGHLLHFFRMADAWLASIDIAIKKAKTAALFTMATADLGEASQSGKPLYQIELTNGGLVTFGGGLLIATRVRISLIGDLDGGLQLALTEGLFACRSSPPTSFFALPPTTPAGKYPPWLRPSARWPRRPAAVPAYRQNRRCLPPTERPLPQGALGPLATQ
ncbi:heme-binding protein [Streptomyces sp. NBC_00237]|uniref:GlcG/HbpS family heme-binding protein n=1 Tax=Streptomyces sp. NBC_00237 TaxID=2975687 RepID=UPI00224CBD11|nr:heme-binding protein [Streptomyces sp. NBC_00237]MCX5205686.1 heme-binding protein [Streptomyces sp. NBC_00237]